MRRERERGTEGGKEREGGSSFLTFPDVTHQALEAVLGIPESAHAAVPDRKSVL